MGYYYVLFQKQPQNLGLLMSNRQSNLSLIQLLARYFQSPNRLGCAWDWVCASELVFPNSLARLGSVKDEQEERRFVYLFICLRFIYQALFYYLLITKTWSPL